MCPRHAASTRSQPATHPGRCDHPLAQRSRLTNDDSCRPDQAHKDQNLVYCAEKSSATVKTPLNGLCARSFDAQPVISLRLPGVRMPSPTDLPSERTGNRLRWAATGCACGHHVVSLGAYRHGQSSGAGWSVATQRNQHMLMSSPWHHKPNRRLTTGMVIPVAVVRSHGGDRRSASEHPGQRVYQQDGCRS